MCLHFENVENPNRATVKILLIILSLTCSLSSCQDESEAMARDTSRISSELVNGTLDFPTLESTDFERIPIPFHMEGTEAYHTLSFIPSFKTTNNWKAENDSYEIDTETETTNVVIKVRARISGAATPPSHPHSHPHTHATITTATHAHSLEKIPAEKSSKETQDLSPLSLSSIDDDKSNDERSEESNKDESVVIATMRIQKRLVEQRSHHHHQQQQQHISEHKGLIGGGDNNPSNSGNSKSPNSTISNFLHIISSPTAGAAPAAPPTASMTTPIAGSSKTLSTVATATSTSRRKSTSKNISPRTHKTDAPMINFILDTFSSANKHHHHDQRYGPHFEDAEVVGHPLNMTVQAGSSIHLNCRISLLQDKTVSWVRRKSLGENALDLLTVGAHTYTGDKRYSLEFQYPSNWRLKITNVKKADEATYECQISTHPPRVIQVNLLVHAPRVMIVDEFGGPLQEKYYEIDSTLQLTCIVRGVEMTASVVYWKHGNDVLNYDVTRGGVSVRTELMEDGANSTLSIVKINKSDSGNYSCSISDFQNFTIVVHILNGESFAELHHGGAAPPTLRHILVVNLALLVVVLWFPAKCIQSARRGNTNVHARNETKRVLQKFG